MKNKKLIIVLGLLAAANLALVLSGKTYIYKALYYNFAGINDYEFFHNRTIPASSEPRPLPHSVRYNADPLPPSISQMNEELGTVGLVLVKNDSLVHESYYDGYSDSSYSNSFSMAKTVVSILIGAAIRDGLLPGVDAKVVDYIPEWKGSGLEDVTIKNLLTMSSGSDWDESYVNPFSKTTEAYYGSNLYKLIYSLKKSEAPGRHFNYLSGDTQVLSLILEKVTGKKTADYAAEKLWEPLGMEHPALWSTDSENGTEKAYCCINSNARDWAKIGLLYLHGGELYGTRVVDSAYAAASVKPAGLRWKDSDNPVTHYGYQWWLIPDYKGQKIFYARGILGQYVIVIPEQNAVVVRLGKHRGKDRNQHYEEVYDMIDWAMAAK